LRALDARARQAAESLAVAVKQLGAGELDGATSALADLRTEIAGLPGNYRDARTRWEAKQRPRARRATSRRRSP
jgi:hypothetical protein